LRAEALGNRQARRVIGGPIDPKTTAQPLQTAIQRFRGAVERPGAIQRRNIRIDT
jgi:hypothetical protein